MSKWERWLLPGILAFFGIQVFIIGGAMVVLVVLSQSIADQAQEIAQLPVATANTLNERGTRVLIEGRIGDRMAFSDRPPLVAYNVNGHSYVPTLWVQIPGKEVEVTAGYQIRSTPSGVGGSDRSSFEVNDPVLVLGTLSVTGDRPVVSEAEIAFGTKEAYLVSLKDEQSAPPPMFSLFLLVVGGWGILEAGRSAYRVWRDGTNFSGIP